MLDAVPLAHFVLTTSPGSLLLHVNDVEAENVESVQLIAAPNEVPRLVVVQRGPAVLEGEGIVHVQAGEGSGARSTVTEWMELLDPEQLERQALDRQGWGSGGLGAEILEVLKELARELPE